MKQGLLSMWSLLHSKCLVIVSYYHHHAHNHHSPPPTGLQDSRDGRACQGDKSCCRSRSWEPLLSPGATSFKDFCAGTAQVSLRGSSFTKGVARYDHYLWKQPRMAVWDLIAWRSSPSLSTLGHGSPLRKKAMVQFLLFLCCFQNILDLVGKTDCPVLS